MHREQSGGEQQAPPRQPSFASVGAQKVRRRHPLRQGGEGGERTDEPRSLLRGRCARPAAAASCRELRRDQ